jgi:hypothetical protein
MKTKTLVAFVLGLGLLWATGCGKAEPSAAPKLDPKPDDKKKKDEDHGHGTGPHEGVVFDVGGGKYHVEFKPSHAKKDATVWILGADSKTLVPIKADKVRLVVSNTKPKIEIDLFPVNPDKDGKASEFHGKDNGFAVEMEYEGTVTFTLDGKQYSGDFEEKAEPKKK